MKSKITFIGLGVMGYPMAGHLAKAGYDVCVFNRTHSKALQWNSDYQGRVANDIATAVEDADFVMMCVGDDNDVMAVGQLAISNMRVGAILIDHTTASASAARDLATVAEQRGVGFLDAPVSGGQIGAQNGQLTIMVGGNTTTYEQSEAVLMTYAKCVKRIGDTGAGQLAKMMNQICIAGVLQGLSEALHFGERAGLDCETVVSVIRQGAAQSWQMENRAHTMIHDQYDFGFAVDWMRKDLSITLAEARKNGATLTLTAMVDQFYADVQKSGGGRWDTSSLMTRLK